MADDSELIGQNEIESLLSQSQGPVAGAPGGMGTADAGSANAGAVGQGASPNTATASAGVSVGGGATTATQAGASSHAATGRTTSSHSAAEANVGSAGDDIQLLLEQAEQAIASVNDPTPSQADFQAFQFRDLAGSPPSSEKATIDLLRDVELDLKIELGRTHMELEELLKLRRGSVVSLDKLAGDPVDVYVNGRLIARGEVLVLNDNFCVRVAELISGDD
jgi:flagellar motor switch protein FliN/FliY